MVILFFYKIVAFADLTHFSVTIFKGCYEIFFSLATIPIFWSQFVHLELINHVKRFLNKLIERIFS